MFPDSDLDPVNLLLPESQILGRSGIKTIIGIPGIGKTTVRRWLKSRASLNSDKPSSFSNKMEYTIIDTPAAEPSDLPPSLAPLLGLGQPSTDTIRYLLEVINDMPEGYWTKLEKLYGIPALVRPIKDNRFVDPAQDLLVHVARKFNRVGKYGPNLESAVEIVVNDFLDGKILWWIKERPG